MDYLYKVPSGMIKTKIIINNLANDAVSVHWTICDVNDSLPVKYEYME